MSSWIDAYVVRSLTATPKLVTLLTEDRRAPNEESGRRGTLSILSADDGAGAAGKIADRTRNTGVGRRQYARWVNLGGDVYSRRRRRARPLPSFLLCYMPTSTASSSSSPPLPPSSSSRERQREKETSTRLAPPLARISSPTEHTTATRQTADSGKATRVSRCRDVVIGHSKSCSQTDSSRDTLARETHRDGVERNYKHAAEQQCSATFLWSAPAGDGDRGRGISTDDTRIPRGSRGQREGIVSLRRRGGSRLRDL